MTISPLSTLSPSLAKAFKGTNLEGRETELFEALAPHIAEEFERLYQEERSTQPLTRFQAEDLESDQLTGQITSPTASQVKVINQLIGWESSADEWLVVPYMASNNLVDFDYRRWHRDAIVGMGLTFKGRPLIFDHAWGDSEKAAAFIFESKLVTEESTTKDILNGGGFAKFNREIIKDEGYIWLYLAAAVPKDSDTAEAILSRRYNDCSTGSMLRQPTLYCPNCSKQKGRMVSFYEKDKNDDYVCPHLIPSNFMFYLVSMYGIDDAEFADYAILSGEYHEAVELSNCNRGALPAASVLRA